MKIRLDNDGVRCACWPGHRCLPCTRQGNLRTRLIIHKWRDDPDTHGRIHGRDELTWQQQVDERDRAWNARDLYSIYCDREVCTQTWWEARWPEYWSRQSVVRDTLPGTTGEDRSGWRAWTNRHQSEDLPVIDRPAAA